MTAPLSLEEARRDVRARAEALEDADLALENTRGCSMLIHPVQPRPGCLRCETWYEANRRVGGARLALEAAQRRLEAVESQQRDVQWIGGER